MTGGGNADSKWGPKKIEGEDGVKTVDCLRGRLLAERMASRNAKEAAGQLGNKLMELENMLKQEAKSRNRAEKKLKLLTKKLESMNISYISDESVYSRWVDKSDISFVSSTNSSSAKDNYQNQQNISKILQTQESMENAYSPEGSEDSQNCSSSLSGDSSANEGSSSSAFLLNSKQLKLHECRPNEDSRSLALSDKFEQNTAQNATSDENSEKSSGMCSNQNFNDSMMDERSVGSYTEEGINEDDDQDPEDQIDNSKALILVDVPQKRNTVDPEVLDATVKEVLDALRYAKEQLQISMDRRRMNTIRVG